MLHRSCFILLMFTTVLKKWTSQASARPRAVFWSGKAPAWQTNRGTPRNKAGKRLLQPFVSVASCEVTLLYDVIKIIYNIWNTENMKAGVGGSGSFFVFSWHVIETELGPNEKHLCWGENRPQRLLDWGQILPPYLFGACKPASHWRPA